jgi:hypothetical protein
MSNILRRYEILLPQQYNDGREIPRKLRGLALKEIVDEFGPRVSNLLVSKVTGSTKVSSTPTLIRRS